MASTYALLRLSSMPHTTRMVKKSKKLSVWGVGSAGHDPAQAATASDEHGQRPTLASGRNTNSTVVTPHRQSRTIHRRPIELSCAGEVKPGFQVLGNGLAEQRALEVARVVELGLCG